MTGISDSDDPLPSQAPTPDPRRRRRSGTGRVKGAVVQAPWVIPRYHDAPICPVGPEGVAAIHDTAMRILEEIGVEFLNDEALDIFRRAGATVTDQNVRMGRDMLMELIAKAPETFTMVPRNPDRALEVAPDTFFFGSVGSPPACHDIDTGRRTGTMKDTANFIRLSQMFNCIHFVSGWPVEPVDIDPRHRYTTGQAQKHILSDKVTHIYSLGSDRVADGLELQRIASGVSREEFADVPRTFTNINSTSPLKHDWPMIDGAMRVARAGQAVVVSPFTLSGAMAPITLAGAIAQQTAECLIAIALMQIVRPGAPCVFGAFTTNVDMKSGAPAFGTPEYMRAMQISGEMARFYKLPLRGSNTNAANFPDAQAAWESAFSLWGVMTGGCNLVYHAAGWMEGGLIASYEKFIMDCELLQQMIRYAQPVSTQTDDLALEVIREVGPNGHFFGTDHTQARYETEFYQPFLSDWRNHGNWVEAGRPMAQDHANRIWKQMLNDYEEPPMDAAIREELNDFAARREREGGAKVDF